MRGGYKPVVRLKDYEVTVGILLCQVFNKFENLEKKFWAVRPWSITIKVIDVIEKLVHDNNTVTVFIYYKLHKNLTKSEYI